MKKKSQKSSILFLRFPLQSSFGGEEKVHLQMAKIFSEKNIPPLFFGSCRVMHSEFKKKNFSSVFFPCIPDITSKISLLLSPFFLPIFFLLGFFVLGYYRFFKGVEKIICMTYIEKIFWTLPAKFFGIQVFWAHHAPLGDWFWKNPYKIFWKFFSRFVEIIVPSQYMKSQLEKISRGKIIVVHNPSISFEKNENSADDKKLKKEKKIIVGTASRLSPEKNIISVIPLAEKFPEILFRIAGIGPEEEKIKELVQRKNLQNIEFLGFLSSEKIQQFFQEIDILYFPSFQEPFGLIAGEAMLQKTFILTSGVDGIGEVVEKYGKIFSLKNNTAGEKLQEILDLSGHEQEKILEGGKNFIEKNFSVRVFEEEIIRMIL